MTVTNAAEVAGKLCVSWDDGTESAFHPLWLRDNCPCPQCRHPQTWERTVDTFALDPAIAAAGVTLAADRIVVAWPDGHASTFDVDWLATHRPGGESDPCVPAPVLWGAELQHGLPSIAFDAVMAGDEGLLAFTESVWTYGVTFVRETPATHGAVMELARRVGHLRETNFGVDWHVVAMADPNNVAYTAIELQLHTDLPNREVPPGIQFLHCLHADAPGGDSTLADGFWVAEEIRRQDPAAFALLSTIPIGYRFHDRDHDLRWSAPVIGLSATGQVREVRFHTALREPLAVAPELVEPMYAALRLFDATCRSAAAKVTVHLQPGDVMVFHNRRALHGRTAFDPAAGRRELHGVYVDADEWLSTVRMLRARS